LKLQETASNVPNMTENHGVPGSTPGPAAFYFLSISEKSLTALSGKVFHFILVSSGRDRHTYYVTLLGASPV
jgi:hypothetical protein